MTSNIIKVSNEKLSPLAETIHKLAMELQTASKRLDEAEARLLAVENSARAQEPRIVELEKQVSTPMERSDMVENYSRHLNIWVVCMAEDLETGQSMEFIEAWLQCVLRFNTKAGHMKLERAHQTLTQKLDPNRSSRSLLL